MDIELLENVLLRFALTEDSQIASSVEKLLVPVLDKLKSSDNQTRSKAIEVLSHIHKRIKPLPEFKLPFLPLIHFYNSLDSSPSAAYALNFGLIYLELAASRANLEEKQQSFPLLLQNITSRPARHQQKILVLWIRILAELKGQDFEKYEIECLSQPALRELLSEIFLDIFFLSSYVSSTERAKADPNAPQEIPAGLSVASFDRLNPFLPTNNTEICLLKEGVVSFLKAERFFTLSEKLLHFVVGSCDFHHTVSGSCEDFLKRQTKIDLEDQQTVVRLYGAFLGDCLDKDPKKRKPMESPVRCKILTYLCKSVQAANLYPQFLQIIFESIFGATTTPKLQQSAMGFVQWVFKQARPEVLNEQIAKIILSGLVKLLNQLEASKESLDIALRSYTFSSLGLLGKRVPSIFKNDFSLLERLFNSVSHGDTSLKVAAQEALSLLVNSFSDPSPQQVPILEKLLLIHSQSKEYQSRYCSLFYMNRIFPFDHVPSRYACLLLSSDPKPEVRDEAKKGLQPFKKEGGIILSFNSTNQQDMEEKKKVKFPEFSPLIKFIADQLNEKHFKSTVATASSPTSLILQANQLPLASVDVFLQVLTFLSLTIKENCRQQSLPYSTFVENQDPLAIQSYLTLIESSISKISVPELQESGTSSLLQLIAYKPTFFIPKYSDQIPNLLRLVRSSRPETRENSAKIITLVSSSDNPHLPPFIDQLRSSLKTTGVRDLLNVEEIHGNILLLGLLTAKQIFVMKLKNPGDRDRMITENEERGGPGIGGLSLIKEFLPLLFKWLSCPNTTVLGGVIDCIGLFGRFNPLPLEDDLTSPDAPKLDLLPDNHNNASNNNPNELKTPKKSELLSKLVHLFNSPDRNVVEKIVRCLGNLGLGERNTRLHTLFVNHLFTLTKYKQEDVHLSIGETFTFLISGKRSKALKDPFLLSYNPTGEPLSQQEIEEQGSYQNVVDDSDQAARTDENDQLAENIIQRTLKEVIRSGQTHVRMAGAIWLMCLVQFSANHPIVQESLDKIQATFQLLLGDIDEVTQEVSSRGIVLIYENCSESQRKELVDSLVGTLSSGSKGIKKTAEDQVFQKGQIGSSPDGSDMSTYRELASMASDLGQPDLLYKFLQLSSHNSMWNSKRGAAFITSSILKQSKEQLTPYLSSLVPLLYRSSYDTNPRIAQSMGGILSSIMNPKKAVDQYFPLVMKELLTGLSSAQWRVRESSCMAVSDVLQGRSYTEIFEYLPELYQKSFERMDDIKETVRAAGKICCRSVCGLSLRLCNKEYTNEKNAANVLDVYLSFLLNTALLSTVEEIRKFTMNQLLKVTQISGSNLEKHSAQIISILLEALSAFEPRTLNYLQFHAESYNITQEQLENVRVQLSKFSPLNDTIELALKHITENNIVDLISKLNYLMKSSLSIPTRVGTGRIIVTLCNEKAPIIKPHITKLLRTILTVGLSDNAITVKKSYASVIGYLCRIMNRKQVTFTFNSLISHYFSKYEETAQRTATVETFREIVKLNTRNDSEILSSELKDLTAFFFFFKHDPEDVLRQTFNDILDELGITRYSIRLYVKEIIYLLISLSSSTTTGWKERLNVENEFLSSLSAPSSPTWAQKKQVALSLLSLSYTLYSSLPYSQLANTELPWLNHLSTVSSVYGSILSSVGGSLSSSITRSTSSISPSDDLLSPLTDLIFENIILPEITSSQRVWAGKESFVLALGELGNVCRNFFLSSPSPFLSTDRLFEIVIHESQKTNTEYKKHALFSLALLLQTYSPSSSLLPQAKSIVYPLAFHNELLTSSSEEGKASPTTSDPNNKAETPEQIAEKRDESLRLASLIVLSLLCLKELELNQNDNSDLLDLLSLLRKQLSLSSWKMKLEILIGFSRLISCLSNPQTPTSLAAPLESRRKIREIIIESIFDTARERKYLPIKRASIDLLQMVLPTFQEDPSQLHEFQDRLLSLIREVRDDQNSTQLEAIKNMFDSPQQVLKMHKQ